MKPKSRRSRVKRYLIAGLLVWVPAGVTFFVLRLIIDLMDRTLLLIPEAYRPDTLLGFRIPGLGILLTATLLLVTGFFTANFVGRRMVGRWESLLSRIPLVSPIYTGVKKVSETLLSDHTPAFRKVLLVEYPRRGLWSLAFMTANQLGEVQAKTGKEVVCVFVPTTPNPTSGFIIMVPREDIAELDMTVDEAFRMIVSLGVVVPSWPHLPAADTKRRTLPPKEAAR
jgi:uncharacterized membrane protein